jgi:hypothetical protein
MAAQPTYKHKLLAMIGELSALGKLKILLGVLVLKTPVKAGCLAAAKTAHACEARRLAI